jgi:hypothetical protein
LCTVPVCIVDGPGRQGQRTGESTSVRFPITDEGKKALTPPSIVLVSPCTHHFFCHLARLWIDWPANEENISGQVRERFATLFCPKVSPRSSRWWWSYLFIHFWNDCRQQRSAAALYLPVRVLLYTNINNKPIDPNIRTVDRQDRAIIVPPSSASRSNLVVRSFLSLPAGATHFRRTDLPLCLVLFASFHVETKNTVVEPPLDDRTRFPSIG